MDKTLTTKTREAITKARETCEIIPNANLGSPLFAVARHLVEAIDLLDRRLANLESR